MNRLNSLISIMILLVVARVASAAQYKFATQILTVPEGFEVEIAAGTDQVPRPVSGSFDEQGRLYVTDSSGSNAKPSEQLTNRTHRVLRLKDIDGDGKFDRQTVFADEMMFPEGCLWYDGSVYVAAPPSIWKLTDTNSDGIADVRVEWHDGKTLTGCANDLHGPYLGPDGWIYWCKGAFAEQTYEVNGKPFTSRAAHIFRARPDHSRLEPVMAGGMDNPVGLAFTPEGERILCGTFFAPQEPGHRDGLIHAIYGGVYGKPNDVLDGHKRTGELMPVMTHMGAAAPAAVCRYESSGFGEDYRDNLFCCQFNLHKVSRHVLVADGSTFKTKDSDFLVSDNPDFHPTDVIEDADGSLLVLDTGAWYKLCCPTSQLAKPDVLGTIYRIRRKGALKVEDPRGLKLAWEKVEPVELVNRLADKRSAVVKRAMYELSKQGNRAVPALARTLHSLESVETRRNAIWALTRIDAPEARAAVRRALQDLDPSILCSALHSISVWRDVEARKQLGSMLNRGARQDRIHPGDAIPTEVRIMSEVLGRIGDEQTVAALLEPWLAAGDRVSQHSRTYALIELNQRDAVLGWLMNLRETWWQAYPEISTDKPRPAKGFPRETDLVMTNEGWASFQASALMALDQMEGGGLKAELMAPLLGSPVASLRQTAMWICRHHPEWGNALAGFFRDRLTVKNAADAEGVELEEQLAAFVSNEAIQQLMAETLSGPGTMPAMRQLILRVMAHASLAAAPKGWPEVVRTALEDNDEALVRAAIAAARTLGQIKKEPPSFEAPLLRMAQDATRPEELRLEALTALPHGLVSVEPELMNFLIANILPAKSVLSPSAAAGALAKAKLSAEQLMVLADVLEAAGPMEVSKVLPAFEQTTNELVGLRLMAVLKESKGLMGVRSDAVKALAAKYPTAVQSAAAELLLLLNVDADRQRARLDELQASLPAGDIRRGQLVFNSAKAACASCHRMGYLGGTVGPDLTAIGPARTERDLLESIVYPSASFVRSYEPFTVVTKKDEEYSGVLRKDGRDEVVLATGPNTEVRVARADIAELRPGRVSVMPMGLDQQLSTQELADLVTFLKNTKWGAK